MESGSWRDCCKYKSGVNPATPIYRDKPGLKLDDDDDDDDDDQKEPYYIWIYRRGQQEKKKRTGNLDAKVHFEHA